MSVALPVDDTDRAVARLQTPAISEEQYIALYDQVYPVVASLVRRSGGTRDDADDIFQDAVIVAMEAHTRGTVIADMERYVTGVARHLMLRRLSGQKLNISLDNYEAVLTVPDEDELKPQASVLLRFLQQSGKKCMDLLSDVYFSGSSLADLAVQHGFKSVRSLSVQKHKCLTKLRSIVKSKSINYEHFTE